MTISKQQLRLIGLTLLAAAFGLAGLFVWLVAEPAEPGPQVTVYVDGQPQQIVGEFESVGDALEAGGIALEERDRVIPSVLAPVDPAEAIAVETARSVIMITEGGQTSYLTSQPTLSTFFAEIGFTPARTDRLIVDGEPISIFEIDQRPLPNEIVVESALEITIVDNGIPQVRLTNAQTVGALLTEVGITIYASDQTDPPLDSWLQPGMTVEVKRATTAVIDVDGQLVESRTRQSTVGAILAEAGIGLVGFDYTIPPLEATVQPGEIIQVIRVTEDFEISDQSIPYQSLLQPLDTLEIDSRQLIQSGIPGIERTRVRVRYENGVEVSRVPDGTWIAAEPQDEIIAYGTNIVIRTVNTPEGPVEYWRKLDFRVTSYMAQTSGKPPDHPAYGITASGVIAGYGVVAVDPKVVPFRSNVYVPGYGVAFVGDTGGGVKGRWIDLGYEDDWDTFVPWSGYTEVYYLTPVPSEVNYLLPTTLP